MDEREELAACPGCASTLGPYVTRIDGKAQVMCTTCGMRGPYARPMISETAEAAWSRLAAGYTRAPDKRPDGVRFQPSEAGIPPNRVRLAEAWNPDFPEMKTWWQQTGDYNMCGVWYVREDTRAADPGSSPGQAVAGGVSENVRKYGPEHFGEAMERDIIADLRDHHTATEAENIRLRAALAQSSEACIYCSLSKEEWAKCQHGFPGCARADDAMGCPELGASMQLSATEAALAEAKEALRPFAKAAEHIRLDPTFSGWSFSSDTGSATVTPSDYARARTVLARLEEALAP